MTEKTAEAIRREYDRKSNWKLARCLAGTIALTAAGAGITEYNSSRLQKPVMLKELYSAEQSRNVLQAERNSMSDPWPSLTYQAVEIGPYMTTASLAESEREAALDKAIAFMDAKVLELRTSPEYQEFERDSRSISRGNSLITAMTAAGLVGIMGRTTRSDLRDRRKRDAELSAH